MNKESVDRKEILARRLKELLTEKEWNNKQFCAEFNSDKSDDVTLSESKLSDILRCNRETSYLVVAKIARILGVSCDYLLGLTNTRTVNPDIKSIADRLGIPAESLEKYLDIIEEYPNIKQVGSFFGFLFEDLYALKRHVSSINYFGEDEQGKVLLFSSVVGKILHILGLSGYYECYLVDRLRLDSNHSVTESNTIKSAAGVPISLDSFDIVKLLGSDLGGELYRRSMEYERYKDGRLQPDELYKKYSTRQINDTISINFQSYL